MNLHNLLIKQWDLSNNLVSTHSSQKSLKYAPHKNAGNVGFTSQIYSQYVVEISQKSQLKEIIKIVAVTSCSKKSRFNHQKPVQRQISSAYRNVSLASISKCNASQTTDYADSTSHSTSKKSQKCKPAQILPHKNIILAHKNHKNTTISSQKSQKWALNRRFKRI